MRTSVIISTFESPDSLERVLWGYAQQSCRPDEIVIADDGSGKTTEDVIETLRHTTGLELVHVRQDHHGFRKCVILNHAIRVSIGDYLIFSDGDCIPRKDYVKTHLSLAQPRKFLSGGVLRIPKGVCRLINRQAIEVGVAFNLRWLVSHGFPLSRKIHLLACNGRWARWADQCTTTRPTFNGHNTSAWKQDIESVNGFDERMRYGGLDRELGERLENNGIRGLQIRHRAVCIHIDHPRPYRCPIGMADNQRIRKDTVSNRRTWTDYGLIKSRTSSIPASFVVTTKIASQHRYSSGNLGSMEYERAIQDALECSTANEVTLSR